MTTGTASLGRSTIRRSRRMWDFSSRLPRAALCASRATSRSALRKSRFLQGRISWPNRCAVQPRGFWQAADQVRILHRLTGRSLAEIVDYAHRDDQVALRIGRIADEREVRAGSPFGLWRLVG